MNDQIKTKAQLIDELAAMRQRITELDGSETKRKQAEEALLNAHNQLQRLLEASPAMIYTCEATGDFDATYISENIKTLIGYDPEEFLSSGFWAKHIHPEDAPRVFANIGQIFKNGQHYHEYRFRHRNGSWN
ncbi:MAG: PAS domain-containing protein [Candidatus Hatepunaea meridiana]|nr:PAS domain-containing protein [Candidatus Hatepunaea meridiana]